MNEKGLGIIECLVAAVIVGIGFVAVYSLSTASTNILLSSIEREKGNMISNMIFEDILTDIASIRTCPTTCNYHNLNFTTPASGTTNSHDVKRTKWNTRSNTVFGSATTNDVRLIEVEQIGSTTKFTITVSIASRDGRATNEFKRVINAP